MTFVSPPLRYDPRMHVTCPKCKEATEVAESEHYSEIECPHCGARFQAVTEATQQASREFLDELLRGDDEPGGSGG